MKFRLLVFLAFEVLCGACTHAQDISDSTPVLRRGATLVLVPTVIKTSSGEPVFGLTANAFIFAVPVELRDPAILRTTPV